MSPPLHLLARAVIQREDRILLAQAKGSQHTFLPGGHLEPGESLPVSLKRELWEELGLAAEVGAYLGLIEHSWEDERAIVNFELNHLFEVALPTLGEGQTSLSREAHLTFFWAEIGELGKQGLEPYPLRHILRERETLPVWATTLTDVSALLPDR